MRRLLPLLERFRRDERGAFLAIFAILAIVLIATSGAVVDYTSVEQARTRAQVALDAAALSLQPKIHEAGVTNAQIATLAENLLIERINDGRIIVSDVVATPSVANGELTLTARIRVPMEFVRLIGIPNMSVGVASRATQGSMNVEVALALDVTGSMTSYTTMNGQSMRKIAALQAAANILIDDVVQDVQTPVYTKMALVPYSNAVNAGAWIDQVRTYRDYTNITDAQWIEPGSAYHRTISAISKANPAVVTTSTAHGFSTGDTVNLSNIAGGGFTTLNNRSVQITVTSTTQFRLNGISSSGYSGTYTANSGRVTMGGTRIASAISKANPGVVTTTMDHGFNTGDRVQVTLAAGGGFTALNNREFDITRLSATTFRLNSTNTSGYSGTYTANSAIVRRCLTDECEVVISSDGHGLATGDYVRITNVGGMTGLNNSDFEVTDVNTAANPDTFVLENTNGPALGTYTSGGRAYCLAADCYFHRFYSAGNTWRRYTISTSCVTERVGAQANTDAAPSTAEVGRNYPVDHAHCPSNSIVPLTSNKVVLHDNINALATTGTTAGHIGLAWAWYLVSPNWAELFTATPSQQPASHDADDLMKVVILMTDGEFNTAYCNGVVSKNTPNVSGYFTTTDKINCNSTNGSAFSQSEALCDNMKDDGILVFTVGFALGGNQDAIDIMNYCASEPKERYSFIANDGDALEAAFGTIAQNITALRISR